MVAVMVWWWLTRIGEIAGKVGTIWGGGRWAVRIVCGGAPSTTKRGVGIPVCQCGCWSYSEPSTWRGLRAWPSHHLHAFPPRLRRSLLYAASNIIGNDLLYTWEIYFCALKFSCTKLPFEITVRQIRNLLLWTQRACKRQATASLTLLIYSVKTITTVHVMSIPPLDTARRYLIDWKWTLGTKPLYGLEFEKIGKKLTYLASLLLWTIALWSLCSILSRSFRCLPFAAHILTIAITSISAHFFH